MTAGIPECVDLLADGQKLPDADNTAQGLRILRSANERFRKTAWPSPFDQTRHWLLEGDARELSQIPDESVHLVVTSPPYWTLKEYPSNTGQLGGTEEYETFLDELDRAWAECQRVLVPGGRICCVVGDVCVPRRKVGRHFVMPLHADIQVRSRAVGLDVLTPILWYKIANGVTEARGNGAGFYGKPYQPGAVVKNDIEYILFLRKGGKYRTVSPLQKALSILTKTEMQTWWTPVWEDLRGASTRNGHPAPYPSALAERLIRMFSFAGDLVLDPFSGTGSTSVAAVASGRSSIGVEIEPSYLGIARKNVNSAIARLSSTGATKAGLVSSFEELTPRMRGVS